MKRNVFIKLLFLMIVAAFFVSFQPAMAAEKKPVVLKTWYVAWPEAIEVWRILSEDLKKLGIELKVQTGTIQQWVGEIIKGKNNTNHFVGMSWAGAPYRLEPSWFLIELFHTSRAKAGGRNYGYYHSEEYDRVVDMQMAAMDRNERQKLIHKAQEILHNDNAFFPIFRRDYIQVYNTERIEGVVPTMGSCIGFPFLPWTFYEAKTKGKIKEPRIVNNKDIIGVNPFAVSEAQTKGWVRIFYDTFASRGKDAKIIPWAAKSWKNIDDKTVDVVLREGMTFHDDKPITIEDAKFSIEYALKWKFPALSEVWRNVERVEVMNKNTLRFHLYKPYAPFVGNVLINAYIVPKHIWEKIPESVGVTNPMDWKNTIPAIGSGPYQIIEWKKGEYFHMKANKKHFQAPNFEGMYQVINPTQEGMMAMLEKGTAEILGCVMDMKQGKMLDKLPHLKMVSAPTHGVYEVRPNFRLAPTNDPEFRKAFQHAINRKGMLDVIYGEYGTVAHNTPITKKLSFWNNPDIPIIEFDLEKARSILKAAGYTWDKKGRLCYP